MKRKRIVTLIDYQRLVGLIEVTATKARMPETVEKLYSSLKSAKMLPSEDVSDEVITMNSKVLLKDLGSGRETELTVTYPRDADARDRKVSVFSPIGVELIGRCVRDIACWKTPGGIGSFEVVKVTYQPEAAGEYEL